MQPRQILIMESLDFQIIVSLCDRSLSLSPFPSDDFFREHKTLPLWLALAVSLSLPFAIAFSPRTPHFLFLLLLLTHFPNDNWTTRLRAAKRD